MVDNVSKVLELISMAGMLDLEKSECRGLHVVLHLTYSTMNGASHHLGINYYVQKCGGLS